MSLSFPDSPHRRTWDVHSSKRGFDISCGAVNALLRVLATPTPKGVRTCPQEAVEHDETLIGKPVEKLLDPAKMPAYVAEVGCRGQKLRTVKEEHGAMCGYVYANGQFKLWTNAAFAAKYFTAAEANARFTNMAVLPYYMYGSLLVPQDQPCFFELLFSYMLTGVAEKSTMSMVGEVRSLDGKLSVCELRARYTVLNDGQYAAFALHITPLPEATRQDCTSNHLNRNHATDRIKEENAPAAKMPAKPTARPSLKITVPKDDVVEQRQQQQEEQERPPVRRGRSASLGEGSPKSPETGCSGGLKTPPGACGGLETPPGGRKTPTGQKKPTKTLGGRRKTTPTKLTPTRPSTVSFAPIVSRLRSATTGGDLPPPSSSSPIVSAASVASLSVTPPPVEEGGGGEGGGGGNSSVASMYSDARKPLDFGSSSPLSMQQASPHLQACELLNPSPKQEQLPPNFPPVPPPYSLQDLQPYSTNTDMAAATAVTTTTTLLGLAPAESTLPSHPTAGTVLFLPDFGAEGHFDVEVVPPESSQSITSFPFSDEVTSVADLEAFWYDEEGAESSYCSNEAVPLFSDLAIESET